MRKLSRSFGFAFKGLRHTIHTQRNMRIHLASAIAVILAGAVLKMRAQEIAILSLAVIFVIIAEIINTAVELSLDFLNGKAYHPSVRMIKDIIAGAVLIASVNAVIVGCVIFLPYLRKLNHW